MVLITYIFELKNIWEFSFLFYLLFKCDLSKFPIFALPSDVRYHIQERFFLILRDKIFLNIHCKDWYWSWSSLLTKAIYRFNAISIKLPTIVFTELEQIISQVVWKYKKTSNSQSNLEEEEWNWRNQPAWLQALLQSHSHQDSMVWQRKIDQCDKIESPKIKPHTYGHLIFDKGGKNIQWRKDNLFNKWC